MYGLKCDNCGTTAVIDCNCPQQVREARAAGSSLPHVDQCPMSSNLGNLLVCKSGTDCCQEDHDHDAAANACPADHSAEPCPDPAGCGVDGHGRGENPDAECQGGHHAKGVSGCTVCRPMTIIAFGPDSFLDLLAPQKG
jgi:hypothetical protein